MKDELPASAPKEASAKMAPPKSSAKKKAKKKAPKPAGSMADAVEEWVRMRKKPSAQESVLALVLDSLVEFEEANSDMSMLDNMDNASRQAIQFALDREES